VEGRESRRAVQEAAEATDDPAGFLPAIPPGGGPFIQFSYLEYVEKERATLDGKKRTGDLLIKARFRGRGAAFLIHLEHQAQPAPDLAWRMLEYVVLDRRESGLPVYPVAVLSHREGAGASCAPLRLDFPNKRVLHFDFDLIDLARLDAHAFARSRNIAGLALAARRRLDETEKVSVARKAMMPSTPTSLDGAIYGY
jgi:hypothetical protein